MDGQSGRRLDMSIMYVSKTVLPWGVKEKEPTTPPLLVSASHFGQNSKESGELGARKGRKSQLAHTRDGSVLE